MDNCTWKGCDKPANHPQIAEDKEQWANLCDEHAQELDWSILQTGEQQDVRALMSAWVKAQGGAERAAKRMMK